MYTRQANIWMCGLALLFWISACSSPTSVPPTPTFSLPSPVPTIIPTSTAIPPTATPTPLACLTQPGEIRADVVPTTTPPQEFLIYLPPCYQFDTESRYPVLYLLHGQTYTDDQWVRLGAPAIADQLIISGESEPFIIVFPDDRYWNVVAGPGFGNRLIYDLIPYVDTNYQTIKDRKFRAMGGLSRGGGWTVKLGFERYDLFGALGLHSPAVFKDNAPYVEAYIKNIPEDQRPHLWFDIGDNDFEGGAGLQLEQLLTRNNYFHEFYRFSGDHSEIYWSAHVDKYIRWYAKIWQEEREKP